MFGAINREPPHDGAGELAITGLSPAEFSVVDGILKRTGTDLALLHDPSSALTELHSMAPVINRSEDPDWRAPLERMFKDIGTVKQAISVIGLARYLLLDAKTGPFLPIFDHRTGRLAYPVLSRQNLEDLAEPRRRRSYLRGEDCIQELGIVLSFQRLPSSPKPRRAREQRSKKPVRSDTHIDTSGE